MLHYFNLNLNFKSDKMYLVTLLLGSYIISEINLHFQVPSDSSSPLCFYTSDNLESPPDLTW